MNKIFMKKITQYHKKDEVAMKCAFLYSNFNIRNILAILLITLLAFNLLQFSSYAQFAIRQTSFSSPSNFYSFTLAQEEEVKKTDDPFANGKLLDAKAWTKVRILCFVLTQPKNLGE